MKRAGMALAAAVMVGVLLAAARPGGSALAQDPTLDAAMLVIIQATRQEQDRRNAVAATRAAVEAEAAQQRGYAEATAAAVAIESTRGAVQVTRSYLSTVAAMDVESTRTARDALATVERRRSEATATQQAVNVEAAAVAVQATRQAMGQAQTAEGFRTGGIIFLFVIGTGLAGLAARGLWRVGEGAKSEKRGVKNEGEPPREDEVPRAPATNVVYDAAAAEMIRDVLAFRGMENEPSIDDVIESGDRVLAAVRGSDDAANRPGAGQAVLPSERGRVGVCAEDSKLDDIRAVVSRGGGGPRGAVAFWAATTDERDRDGCTDGGTG